MLKKTLYTLCIIIIIAGLLEAGLRSSGKYLTYTERVSGNFLMEYDRSYDNGHLFNYSPNQEIVHRTHEFEFTCQSNDSGFRDRIWNVLPGQTTIGIIGDSFVEGVGAGCDQSMPSFFHKSITARTYSTNVDVLNAGISGSDIFYAYKVIEKVMIDIQPEIVILGINSSDVYEYISRGGFERFLEGGKTVHRTSPVSLRYYSESHLFRFYTHEVRRLSRYTFLSKKGLNASNLKAGEDMLDAIIRTDSLCRTNNMDLYIFFYPFPEWVEQERTDEVIDGLAQNSFAHGINTIDLSRRFEAIAADSSSDFAGLYWPEDGHFRDRGYEAFAGLLLDELDSAYPGWLKSTTGFNSTNGNEAPD